MENNVFEQMKRNPQGLLQEASRRDFLAFARYMQPSLDVQPFHKIYYHVLNLFAHGMIKKLIVTVPPQHGKSEGSSRKLPAYLLGINPELKVFIGSYSTDLARGFNADVQRIMESPEYNAVFPNSVIPRSAGSQGRTSAKRSSAYTEIVGHRGSLASVGRGGALTGKTVDIAILDDIYKDYTEANSAVIRESAWKWYTTVVRSRLHNDSQQLIVYTRWHEDDVVGRIEKKKTEPIIDLKSEDDLHDIPEGAWLRINFQALKESPKTQFDQREKGEALWESKHSRKRLEEERKLDPIQFECLYQGNPKPAEGYMYSHFKTYEILPTSPRIKKCYVDTADTGADYLCAIFYEEYTNTGECYVTDVLYTNKPMEFTEVRTAEMLCRNGTQVCIIESNNGGRGFSRNVERNVRELGNQEVTFIPVSQSANKDSRIFSNSAKVQNMIYFPTDWEDRWYEYYSIMISYRKEGGNEHDDAPDATTGVVEKIGVGSNFGFIDDEEMEDELY